jgi:hypothetical protein
LSVRRHSRSRSYTAGRAPNYPPGKLRRSMRAGPRLVITGRANTALSDRDDLKNYEAGNQALI